MPVTAAALYLWISTQQHIAAGILALPHPKIHNALPLSLHSANIHNFFLFRTPQIVLCNLHSSVVSAQLHTFLYRLPKHFQSYLLPLT